LEDFLKTDAGRREVDLCHALAAMLKEFVGERTSGFLFQNRWGIYLAQTKAPKGQRILWMKQQADRLDPMLSSPPSILDRKGELGPRWQYS
jgi:hypothetical protein